MTVEHEQRGPLGLHAEQVVRRAGRLTADECRRLASAWHAWTAPAPADGPLDFGDTDPWQVASDEWNDAEDALVAAARTAGRSAPFDDAGRAAWDAAREAALNAAIGTGHANHVAAAADLAASVAATADLTGTEGFTVEHVELLLGPWRAVVDEDGEPVCECGR